MLGLSQCLEHAISVLGVERGPVLDGLAAATQQGGAAELGWLMLGVALAPGFAEEVFARGWIQRGLAVRAGPLPAIAASALLFGALHGHPVHAAAATVLGLWLGWIVHVDGGLRVAIVAHVLNNASAIASAALVASTHPTAPESTSLSFDASWTGLAAALSALALLTASVLELRTIRAGIHPPPPAAPHE
jgi:hypothetical protein